MNRPPQLTRRGAHDFEAAWQVAKPGSEADGVEDLGHLRHAGQLGDASRAEGQFGTRLMQRSTRRLELTPAGQAFDARCAGAVDGLLEAGQSLLTNSHEPSGLVRVAAPADFFDFFRMEWVSTFLLAHPRVRLDFVLSDARLDVQARLLVPVLPQHRHAGPGIRVL